MNENSKYFDDFRQNSDYRVIALDAKPGPGRLDDFIPEVEREEEKSVFFDISSNIF